MKVVSSKICKKELYLVDTSKLEEIMNTGKIQNIDSPNEELNTIYLIKEIYNFPLSNKHEEDKSIKVLLLRNKFTNKLSDSCKRIEQYLEYAKNNLEDPTYIAIEVTISKYIEIKSKTIEISNKEGIERMKELEFDIEEKIKSIESPIDNNETLIISEKQDKIYLPYTIDELEEYARCYPAEYPSLETVVKQEYMIPLSSLYKNPAHARFTETYYLIKKREGKNFVVALIYAIIFVTKSELNPAIIAACKNKNELIEYMNCLKENKLEDFKHFKIVYDEKIGA